MSAATLPAVAVAGDQTIPSRDEMAAELTRLDVAFVQAEQLAHQVEFLTRSANDAYQAVSIARDAAYLLAAWRLGIPERSIDDGYTARFHDDIRTALGIEWKEFGDREGGGRGAIYRHEMTDEDHRRLLDVLDVHPGPVVLSGYASDLYDGRLTRWRRIERSNRAYRGADRTEVLWLNPVAAATARQRPMFEVGS